MTSLIWAGLDPDNSSFGFDQYFFKRRDAAVMKLKLKCCASVHKEMVTAVAWTPDNELYSMSDDNTIHRWDGSGDPAGKVWHIDAERC